MSDEASPLAGTPPTDARDAYVVEHYGFSAPSDTAASAPPPPPPTAAAPRAEAARAGARTANRRTTLLAAGALSLVLTGGIGGYAAAAADNPADGRGDGRRGAVTVVDSRDGTPRAGFDGSAGRR